MLMKIQWLATGRLFSRGTPFSSTNKTDRHDINKILLKVASNTINQTKSDLNKYISDPYASFEINYDSGVIRSVASVRPYVEHIITMTVEVGIKVWMLDNVDLCCAIFEIFRLSSTFPRLALIFLSSGDIVATFL